MSRGAVASGDPASAEAGARVLREGGNAVDSVVAMSLMSGFTLPTLAGLGGAGLVTYRIGGDTGVLDCFSTVPGLGDARTGVREAPAIEIDFEGVKVSFRVGPRTVAVPGNPAGLWELHRRYGRIPMAAVAAPTIEAARDGIEVNRALEAALALLVDILRFTPECWELVSANDAPLARGGTLRNPALAATVEAFVEEGPRLFYEGEVAHAMVEAAEGWMSLADLAAYEPVFREPLRGSYRGWSILAPGIPSLSGAMILRSLAHLETRTAHGHAERTVEALQAGEAIRTDDYEQHLFDEGYLEHVAAGSARGATMHCAAADRDDNVVSHTSTVGESCGVVAPGTGMMLNNFLGEDDIQPAGAPLPPGSRMLTSICPLILDSGRGRIAAVGSSGSSRIRSAIVQVVSHLVDEALGPAAAVRRPRVHWESGTLYIEGYGREEREIEQLRGLVEHSEVTRTLGFFFGGAQAVECQDAAFGAGADNERRGGAAIVL